MNTFSPSMLQHLLSIDTHIPALLGMHWEVIHRYLQHVRLMNVSSHTTSIYTGYHEFIHSYF